MSNFIEEISEGKVLPENIINNTSSREDIEGLALVIQTERLKSIESELQNKVNEVKVRQAEVKKLHDILGKINSNADAKGNLDIKKNKPMQELINNARELGIEIAENKVKWNPDEKDRLVENIRMKCEDLNSANQIDLQDSQMMMNRRFEVYELTKSILKPLHDDKINKARKTS